MLFASLLNYSHAEDVWFALDAKAFPPPGGTTRYPSADAACRSAYEQDSQRFASDISAIQPYIGAMLMPYSANPYIYDCRTPVLIGGAHQNVPHVIVAIGDRCESGESFDFELGRCASSNEAQDRKQRGDPNNEPNNVPNDCQGNPINAAIGNKFESEVDFASTDGELAFRRYYNGSDGLWRHSYSASIAEGSGMVLLTLDDGRASAFTISGDTIVAEASERGSLTRSGSDWVYYSPRNETLVFNGLGRLISVKSAIGHVQTLDYAMDDEFSTRVTVRTSRGHELSFTKSYEDRLIAMVASGVAATYDYSANGQLLSVTRSMQTRSISRNYLYEDPRRSSLLTGLIDERGIRVATWTYDDKGRAISSEHAGGVDKVNIVYGHDGTTTVTNALGHLVTYRYATVAGTKRMISVTGEPAPGCPIANSSFTYDERGQIATKVDALGRVTAFTYDPQGRETLRVEAQGTSDERTVSTAWDGSSFRPAVVTSSGRVTSYTYDAAGRLTSTSIRSTRD